MFYFIWVCTRRKLAPDVFFYFIVALAVSVFIHEPSWNTPHQLAILLLLCDMSTLSLNKFVLNDIESRRIAPGLFWRDIKQWFSSREHKKK